VGLRGNHRNQCSQTWCRAKLDDTGDGDGERDGHELLAESKSELWLAVSEGGWINTGVIGGESDRVQSALARISVWTSPSQPSLTPSTFSKAKKVSEIGVCCAPLVDGGLLMELPEAESGGVEGKP
jgi:hypothetical protein